MSAEKDFFESRIYFAQNYYNKVKLQMTLISISCNQMNWWNFDTMYIGLQSFWLYTFKYQGARCWNLLFLNLISETTLSKLGSAGLGCVESLAWYVFCRRIGDHLRHISNPLWRFGIADFAPQSLIPLQPEVLRIIAMHKKRAQKLNYAIIDSWCVYGNPRASENMIWKELSSAQSGILSRTLHQVSSKTRKWPQKILNGYQRMVLPDRHNSLL